MANEKRLIDANAFIEELDSFVVNPPFAHPATPWHRGITLAAETALRMPTVDAVEVVHGSWVSLTDCANAGVYCSVCNKKVYKEDYAWCNRKNKLRSNYCPNCGAKMDGEGMYKSPIDIIYGQMETQIEGDILRAVQKYGINVDKDELIRALQYDREQYHKGYADGKKDAMAELVKCEGCGWYRQYEGGICVNPKCGKSFYGCPVPPNHFCSYGERREGE